MCIRDAINSSCGIASSEDDIDGEVSRVSAFEEVKEKEEESVGDGYSHDGVDDHAVPAFDEDAEEEEAEGYFEAHCAETVKEDVCERILWDVRVALDGHGRARTLESRRVRLRGSCQAALP